MPGGERAAGASASVSRRRVLETAGVAGLGGVGLAGCIGRGATGPQTVEIAANTDVKDNIDAIESELHEAGLSQDVEIDVIAGSASTGARKQQYNRWLSANLERPSLFMMDSGWTIPFVVRDQVANISKRRPAFAKNVQKEVFDTFVESVEGRNGDLYGLPLFPTTGSILYRKDLVKEAGYSPDEEGWATDPLSWKRFSKITKDVQEQADTNYGFTFQADAYEGLSCCDFKEFTATWGGSYFGARENLFGPVDDRPVTVDSDPVIRATRMVRTFIDADASNALDSVAGGISPRAVLQWSEEPSRKPFTNGEAVMHRNWPYAVLVNGAEDVYGEDMGLMPIPYGVKKEDATFEGYGGSMSSLGGWHVCLNPNSPKADMALDVMEAMATDRFQLFLFEKLGWLPPRPKLFESKRAKQVPVMGRYLDTLKRTVANSVPRPVTVAWPQESTKIAQKANASLSGEASPTRNMKALAQQLQLIETASARETSEGQSGSSNGGT